MRRAWFVWKFRNGRYHSCLKVPAGFDAADRLVAELTRLYADLGWRYEVSEYAGPPSPEFCDQGNGI